jgi:uncharacterized protein (TIGR03435 family)
MRFFCLLLVLPGLCAAAEVQVGRPAPPLVFRQILQAPAGTKASWDALKGSAAVLEFWATWCPGCRDQIPHLNRLAEELKSKPLRFISITDEEPGIVQRFLKDYAMSGWIGLDSAGATFKEYGIVGRPQAVLVDANGIVRGIGPPSELTGELMENFLEGKEITLSPEAPIKLQSLPEPFFELMVRPAAPVDAVGYSPGAESGKPGRSFEAWGFRLRGLLSTAYDVPEERVLAPAWADETKYDVAIAAPELTPARKLELLQRALETTFQVKAHKESRESQVFVLKRRASVEPALRPATSASTGWWGTPGNRKAVAAPTSFLADIASRALRTPVLDETGMQGQFDFELKWEVGNPTSFIEAVRDQLRLELVQARRPLEYLVVDSAAQPRAW